MSEAVAERPAAKPRLAEPQASAPAGKVTYTKAKQTDLFAVVQSVAGIVERRSNMPVLQNVLIKKDGSHLTLTTYDGEIQLAAGSDLGAGPSVAATTVNARKLAEILRSIEPQQMVTLESDGPKLLVRAGKSRFSVQTLPAEDFPTMVAPGSFSASFTMPQRALRSLLEQVQFAMAANDIRVYLNGLLMDIDDTKVTAVCTDGHRMALSRATLPEGAGTKRVIIPRKAVLELSGLLANSGEEPVEVQLGDTQAKFSFGGMTFTTKLLEGSFPDYNRVLPKGLPVRITFERAMLLGSLQRAALLTTEKFKGVEMTFAPGALTMQTHNAEQETANEEIGIDYEGAEFTVGFNIGYLRDVLQNIEADTVSFSLRDANSSGLFTDPDHPEFLYVVMPMRI